MDYYEEIGVDRRASVEEIHRARRNLARLLHPDQQQEECLRLLAEKQMKRLNEICAVLTDPVLRIHYDRGLLGGLPPPPPPPWQARLRSPWALAAALSVLVLTAALLYPSRPAPRLRSHAPVTVPVAPAATPKRPRRRIESHDAPVAAQRFSQPAPPRLTRIEAQPEIAVSPALPPPAADLRPAAPAALPVPAPQPAAAGVAGAWFYVPQKAPAANVALYPPEFIELFITEAGGALHGRYRARYKVGDRPISGDVQFWFDGPEHGDPVAFSWAGSGGASGEVRLKLLSNDTLQLSWKATEFGVTMGLASGTAILTRRREL
jgi:hypothetical protein